MQKHLMAEGEITSEDIDDDDFDYEYVVEEEVHY